MPVRIDKFLSNLKYGSRSDMKNMIKERLIEVDGQQVSRVDQTINPLTQTVKIDGVTVFYQDPIHIALYKPEGFLSANTDPMHPVAVSLIQEPYSRFDLSIAGRLDLDAEGLLILTTDGDLLHQITHPNQHLPKTYEVTLDHAFYHQKALLSGVLIKDGKGNPYLAKALAIEHEGIHVKIIIDEGKFHQVKRMFGAVGYEVIHLKRTSIGKLSLGELKPGQYRTFRKEELI
jgi:16S rRNA pseudouridine516 synthase